MRVLPIISQSGFRRPDEGTADWKQDASGVLRQNLTIGSGGVFRIREGQGGNSS